MRIGAIRLGADMRSDAEMLACEVISPQMGSFKGANQSGMQLGAVRHGGDLHVDPMVDVASMPLHQCWPDDGQSGMRLVSTLYMSLHVVRYSVVGGGGPYSRWGVGVWV